MESIYMIFSAAGKRGLHCRQNRLLTISILLFATSLLFIQGTGTFGQQHSLDSGSLVVIPTVVPSDPTLNTQQSISAKPDRDTSVVRNPTDYFVATQAATCQEVEISSISASGNDGNLPSNTIDNNISTRWSDNGVGSWIQLDLGSKKNLCSVDIAWYRGNARENNFVILVSDDGISFTNKFSSRSSGSTTSLEKYTLPAGTEARYVRITVNGNTENNWASITEIGIFGSTGTSNGGETIGSVFHKWQTSPGSTTWTPYESLEGGLRSNIEVVANSDGRLEVFVVGTNNALYHKWQLSAGSSSSWSN
ncbi:MAG: discoidin domain-containing protein, partial [Nitrososphaeraceae archaeon]